MPIIRNANAYLCNQINYPKISPKMEIIKDLSFFFFFRRQSIFIRCQCLFMESVGWENCKFNAFRSNFDGISILIKLCTVLQINLSILLLHDNTLNVIHRCSAWKIDWSRKDAVSIIYKMLQLIHLQSLQFNHFQFDTKENPPIAKSFGVNRVTFTEKFSLSRTNLRMFQ